ncbi:MAG TPA: hypothetical protein VJA46_11980 [Acidimicrobiia bacterium]|nr:hypothetical protein [Acidimicrobiia bacterium]
MSQVSRAALVVATVLMLAACAGGEVSSVTERDVIVSKEVVEVSGAETLTIFEPGGCGPHAFEPGAWNGMFSTDGSEPWLLDVTIVTFEAPKVYETSAQDESGKASIFLTNGAGTTYETTDGTGIFAVDEGGLSGSLDITLTNADDGSTVSLNGSFTCEDLS